MATQHMSNKFGSGTHAHSVIREKMAQQGVELWSLAAPGMNDDYPYRWSAGIKEFCMAHDRHPNCTKPIRRAFIEGEFIAHTINNPEQFKSLDDYLKTVHTNAIGESFQWLKNSPIPIPDDPHERAQLSQLYTQIDCQTVKLYIPRTDFEPPFQKKDGSTGKPSFPTLKGNSRKSLGHNLLNSTK